MKYENYNEFNWWSYGGKGPRELNSVGKDNV